MTKSRIDWQRLSLLAILAATSIFLGIYFQPAISGKQDTINTFVTIFSILAGFLLAAITIATTPYLNGIDTKKELKRLKPTIVRRMRRHELLFYFYLMTLGAALIVGLLNSPEQAEWKVLAEKVFLSLAIFVFLTSFKLPTLLIEQQLKALERAERELDTNN